MSSTKQKQTFESALLNALKTHGLLLPSGNEDEGTTENILPEALNNPDSFIKKEAKVIPLNPAFNRTTKKNHLAKVALKSGPKSKKNGRAI